MTRRRTGSILVFVALGAILGWLWSGSSAGVGAPAVGPGPLVSRPTPAKRGQAEEPPAQPVVATEAPDQPHWEVRCPLVMADPVEGEVEVVVDQQAPEPDMTSHVMGPGQIHNGQLVFADSMPGSLHRGDVKVPGYVRTRLEWVAGDDGGYSCAPVTLQQAAAVVGTVRGARVAGSERPMVVGCASATSVHDDGTYYLEVGVEPCALRAERRDGTYVASSDEVSITPTLGEEIEVDFALPDRLQAGMGTSLVPADGGMLVEGIRTGSAAAAAGLAIGDLIVAVNGQDVGELEVEDVSAITVGDVGGRLELDVLTDGVRERLVLTRTFVPSARVAVPIEGGFEMVEDPNAWQR